MQIICPELWPGRDMKIYASQVKNKDRGSSFSTRKIKWNYANHLSRIMARSRYENQTSSVLHLEDGRSSNGAELTFSKSGPLLRLFKLLLSLAELSQVEGSNLLSLFNLLLVGLDLSLQLGSKITHPVLVLSVLFIAELHLLDLALRLLGQLGILRSSGLASTKLNLKLSDLSLKLGHGSTSSTHGSVSGFSEPVLNLPKLSLKSSLSISLSSNMILLSSQFISKTGSINHCLLGLLLAALGLMKHIINLSLHGVHIALKAALLSSCLGVNGAHVINSNSGLNKLSLSLTLATISRVKQSSGLLHLSTKSLGFALMKASLLIHLLASSRCLLITTLSFTELSLVSLDGLLSFIVSFVGMIKSNLKLIDLSLQLLLDSEGLSLGSLLAFKASLHAVHGSGMVLPSIVELFFLFSHSSVNLLSDLAKLKSSLEFFLLNLQPSALFVKLMNRATTISKLVKEILDFISKILVLSLDNIKLFSSLIKTCLQSKLFSIHVAALRLASFKLSLKIFSLCLPLSNNLLKVLASLFSDDSCSMSAFILKCHFFKFSFKSMLGFLSRGNLLIERLNVLFSFHYTSTKLVSVTLKLVNSSKSFSLKLGFPQLDLSLSLGEGPEGIILLISFLINFHLEVFSLSGEVLKLSEQGSTVSGFSISKSLGIFKLRCQGNLILLHVINGALSLLNLSGKILAFNCQLLLGGISFIKSTCNFIQFLIGLNNGGLSHLAVLLHVSSISHRFL